MLILIVLVAIWGGLMLRSVMAEYKYYQSVKTLEPEIWQRLGSPKFLKIPIVFVSAKGVKALRGVTNNVVCELANRHRKAGILFLGYILLVLVSSIVYFKVV